MELCADGLTSCFNATFLETDNAALVGGADEPFYLPADAQRPAQIRFRADYVRSALHEAAHWCVAGVARRALPDYGYWYSPDDRDLSAQRAFFAVEARPQAIERHFCEALGVPFSASIDNLSLTIPESDNVQFLQRLDAWYHRFQTQGLPPRAARFVRALAALRLQTAA